MKIFSGIIFLHGKPIFESGFIEGNHVAVAEKIVKYTNRNNQNICSDFGNFIFCVKQGKLDIAYVVLASYDTNLQILNIFLDRFRNLFLQKAFRRGKQTFDFDEEANVSLVTSVKELISEIEDEFRNNEKIPIDREMISIHTEQVIKDKLEFKVVEETTHKNHLNFQAISNIIVSFVILIIALIVLWKNAK